MTRGVPLIKRVRQTRYVASDGRAFDSHVEAFRHETHVKLAAFLAERTILTEREADTLAGDLLESSEIFSIQLLLLFDQLLKVFELLAVRGQLLACQLLQL